MNDILPVETVERLTGKTQSAAQCRWLTKHGWVYEKDGRGRPVVDRGYYSMRMGASDYVRNAPITLDFSLLNG